MQRDNLLNHLHELLKVDEFHDYCPQGLQIEGNMQINKIVTAVTASLQSIEFAVAEKADMLLVHHGMFWKNESPTITGWKKNRIQRVLDSKLNLVVYHLPLDAHAKLGNNAQLAKKMQWIQQDIFGPQGLIFMGELEENKTLCELSNQLAEQLQRPPLVVGNQNKIIKRIAWCTGGGQGFFLDAVEKGIDAYVTGEASEAQYHLAREHDVAFISAGHHATERYGVLALGEHIQNKYNLDVIYFDEDNPI